MQVKECEGLGGALREKLSGDLGMNLYAGKLVCTVCSGVAGVVPAWTMNH